MPNIACPVVGSSYYGAWTTAGILCIGKRTGEIPKKTFPGVSYSRVSSLPQPYLLAGKYGDHASNGNLGVVLPHVRRNALSVSPCYQEGRL